MQGDYAQRGVRRANAVEQAKKEQEARRNKPPPQWRGRVFTNTDALFSEEYRWTGESVELRVIACDAGWCATFTVRTGKGRYDYESFSAIDATVGGACDAAYTQGLAYARAFLSAIQGVGNE